MHNGTRQFLFQVLPNVDGGQQPPMKEMRTLSSSFVSWQLPYFMNSDVIWGVVIFYARLNCHWIHEFSFLFITSDVTESQTVLRAIISQDNRKICVVEGPWFHHLPLGPMQNRTLQNKAQALGHLEGIIKLNYTQLEDENVVVHIDCWTLQILILGILLASNALWQCSTGMEHWIWEHTTILRIYMYDTGIWHVVFNLFRTQFLHLWDINSNNNDLVLLLHGWVD
jgi:hypothetical protein